MKRLPLSMMKAVGAKKYNDLQTEWNSQMAKYPDKPTARVNGNEVIRRFADGRVDHYGTAEKALYSAVCIRENVAPLNHSDLALLVLVMPKEFGHLMDPSIARSYCRNVDPKDTKIIQEIIKRSVRDPESVKDLK